MAQIFQPISPQDINPPISSSEGLPSFLAGFKTFSQARQVDERQALAVSQEKFRREEKAAGRAEAEARELDIQNLIIAANDPEKTIAEKTRINARIAGLDPEVAKGLTRIFETGVAAEKDFLADAALDTFRWTGSLKGIKDENLNSAIRKRVNTLLADPNNREESARMIGILNKSPEEQRTAIMRENMLSRNATQLAFISAAEGKRKLEDQRQQNRLGLAQEQSRLRGVEQAAKPITDTSLIKNLKAIGVDPTSPEGERLVRQAITKPATQVNINQANQGLFKTPEGFMLLDRNNPAKGVTPIPGGPKDNLTGENAAKAQGLRSAIRLFNGDPANNVPSARDLVFDEDGTLNQTNLINAAIGTFLTDGRLLRLKMEQGIQAVTRAETGAVMAESELDNTRARFMPSLGDTVEIANLKLGMFQDWITGGLKLMDPSGRFLAERFQSELDKRSGKATEQVAPQAIPQNRRKTDGLTPQEQTELQELRKRFGR